MNEDLLNDLRNNLSIYTKIDLDIKKMDENIYVLGNKINDIKRVLVHYINVKETDYLFELFISEKVMRLKLILPKKPSNFETVMNDLHSLFINVLNKSQFKGFVATSSKFSNTQRTDILHEKKEEIKELIDKLGIVDEIFYYTNFRPLYIWSVGNDTIRYYVDIDLGINPTVHLYDYWTPNSKRNIIFSYNKESLKELERFRRLTYNDYYRILRLESRIDNYLTSKGYEVETDFMFGTIKANGLDFELTRIERKHREDDDFLKHEYYIIIHFKEYNSDDSILIEAKTLKGLGNKIKKYLEKRLN